MTTYIQGVKQDAGQAQMEQERAALAMVQAALLDEVLVREQLKNDAALSRLLEVRPPVISKLRNGHLVVSPGILIALSEVTDLSIREMKQRLGYKILARPAAEAVEHHPV